ncbi:MAG: hypothetical protein IPH76_14640 [Xanthomonadales bacterium]|nr:hypothetical protein [Xanthomonadales bacterium]
MDPSAQQFSAVPERNTGDVILRTAQQHHVQMSVMAGTPRPTSSSRFPRWY